MASEWLFPTNEEDEEPSDKTREEELFVFGYHCKLFRDDEQANMVDSGTYMIPWMGNEKLKIDRYDGRGHLYDLRQYDADNLKGKPEPVFTEDEIQIEKLCDEERYLELNTDIAMKNMYEEEEWKRYYESLSEGYQAVGFSYDAYGQVQNYTESVFDEPNPEEAVFVPAKELQVPVDLPIPATVKENAIIEKTAKFIAEHGIQMEIVMKTKQSNNPQFQFMHFENAIHPYYKHLVKMIKSKKYIPKSPVKEEPPDSHNDSAEGDGYLHPTLMTTNRASPTPQEVYKPVPMPKVSIHETSYGQLLQSMSKVNKELAEKNREKETKIKKEVKTEPPDTDTGTLPATSQPAYGSSMPPPPGIEPVQLPCDADVKQEPNSLPRTSSPPAQIVPPPPDLQPIIDRMAMYVAKNGEEFAIVVKSKKDTRFQFLETWHTHYPYYDFKRHLFQEELEREKKEEEEEEKKKEQEKADILARGVKFKLKKAIKEQESSTTLEKKPVFDYDDSGEENDDSDSNVIRAKSNNVSGTSTPVRDGDGIADSRTSEQLERKLAEQRLKDRLAASAREKLSQVDKEKQIKLERKKKAAMFINLLKSKNGEGDEESKASDQVAQVSGLGATSKTDDSSSSRNKSKHKTRDRSRSRDRDSRSRRSRSRSSSRSKSKKKKRHRSPTPPSAYNISWRSSARFPPPPPPRYNDIRSRYSRSPSKGRNSRHRSRSRSKGRSSKQRSRSRSPQSRSKSKKKKRSKSPKSRKDDSSHRKSSKKKKKRSRSRSRSKSVDKKSQGTSVLRTTESDSRLPSTSLEPRVSSPADNSDCCIVEEPLEEGETRESSPEPGQITDNSDITYKDSSQRSTPVPPDIETTRHKRKRSSSPESSRSRSNTPKLLTVNSRKSRSKSKSPSKSPLVKASMEAESVNGNESSPVESRSLSREATPVSYTMDPVSVLTENAASNDIEYSAGPESTTDKNVSSYMLDRVRAMLKASRESVKDEDQELDAS